MKQIIKTTLLLALFSNFLFAFLPSKTIKNESEPKVIVLINHADWCPVCKSNGDRVKTEVISKFITNSNYNIIVNNLTDKNTKLSSSELCNKAGIGDFASKNTSTGNIYFINPADKSLKSTISVTESSDKIYTAFVNAITN